MDEYKSYIKIESSSERNFGLVFTLLFLLISLYYYFFYHEIKLWILFFTFSFLVISLFFPKLLFWPNKIWFKFGELIGLITSPLIMFFIYIITFVPLGLIIRIFNNYLINQKFDKKIDTYWVKKRYEMESLKKQF